MKLDLWHQNRVICSKFGDAKIVICDTQISEKKICDTKKRPKYRICVRDFDMFHVTNLFWHYVIYEQSLIYIQILCLISTTIMSYSWKDSFLWYAVLTWLLRDSPLEGDHCKLLQPGTLHLPILDNTCFHRSHISFGNKTPFNFTKKI